MTENLFLFLPLLSLAGVLAGVVNTVSGGGSNLTVPLLMIMGLPADMANASNRVGILAQCVVSVRGFSQRKVLETQDLRGILMPTMLGGLVGAVMASFAPNWLLKPVLLSVIVGLALITLLKPDLVVPVQGEAVKRVAESRRGFWMLFAAGIYGGFVQAGVGLILMASLAGALRYQMLQANALKLLCTVSFTVVALLVFVWRGQVVWLPALALAVGTMVGGYLGVKLAMKLNNEMFRWMLFAMSLVACAAAVLS